MFDLLPLIGGTVHLTRYTFRERCAYVSGIDVTFFNACLALATGM